MPTSRIIRATRFAIAAICLLSTASAYAEGPSVQADKSELASLIGEWQVRIDGGGEIYSATIKIRSGKEGMTGVYRSAGHRGRVTSVEKLNDLLNVQVETRRSGMPAKGLFAFELIDNRWVGDVDFESGSSVRSYEFSAKRLDPPAPTTASPPVPKGQPKPQPSGKPAAIEQGSVRFQNGANGYAGTLDTEIWAIAPSKALDRQGTMTADGNNGGGESQVLMRFDDIFNTDGSPEQSGLPPAGCRVVSAKLTIIVFDPGSTVYLHRVLVPWNASATWTNMAAGVTIDNLEASNVRDGFSFGEITMDKQTVEFDVTQTVQKWADGEPNYGWVFINTGGNGWDFYSSDWLEADLRPVLEIQYERRATETADSMAAAQR